MRHENQKSRKFLFLSLIFILLISACAPKAPTAPPDQVPQASDIETPEQQTTIAENDPTAAAPTAAEPTGMACLDEGYPCSYAEADPAILDASAEVLDQAALALDETGDIEAAAAVLKERNDLADILYSYEGIRFRLEGGPVMWLINGEAFLSGTKGFGGSRGGTRSTSPVQFSIPSLDLNQDDGPIGESRRGEEPFKKALILSPFWWEFGGDETQQLSEYLRQVHRNYNCDDCEVHWKINNLPAREPEQTPEIYELTKTLDIDYGISILDYMTWEDFDLVHVSTHGSQVCSGGRCGGYIMTGRYLDDPKLTDRGLPDVELPGLSWGKTAVPGCGALETRMQTQSLSDEVRDAAYDEWRGKGCGTFTKRWWQFAGPDFFNAHYGKLGKSLDDKLIFINSCESMKDLGLAKTLAGDNTTVLGWTEVVDAGAAGMVAMKFYEYYVGRGLRAKVAFDKVKEELGDRLQADSLRRFRPKGITIEALLPPEFVTEGDEETRGREIITLMQPVYRVELEEKDAVPTIGIPGDGQDDQIMLLVQVDGIDEDQDPNGFEIHFAVDGEELNETIKPQEKIGEYEYWALGLLPLPFDVGKLDQIKLEAWVVLPEGGQSRHVLEDVSLANCGWQSSLSGGTNSSIKGDIVFPSQTLSEANAAQLTALAEGGYLGPTSAEGSGIPTAAELASLPESYMLGNRQELPFMMLIPDQAANAMLERNTLAMGTAVTVNLSQDDGERIEGTFSADLTDLLTQQTFNAAGEFTWHTESLCSMDVILELGTNPFPESMIPASLAP